MSLHNSASPPSEVPLPKPSWQFASAGQISFGRGCRYQLSNALQMIGSKKPIVVTDHTIVATEPVAKLLDSLRSRPQKVLIYDRCQAEPSIDTALEAIAVARDGQADCVIAIGGGSCIDVGKIVAVVAKHGGNPKQYFGFGQVPGPTLPAIALPTTAGTGSEVSHSAVLTDTLAGTKVSTLSPYLRPMFALIDPELTDTCPTSVTAASGIDALVHAVEAYLNRSYDELETHEPTQRSYCGHSPMTEILSREAITRIGRSLVPLVEHLKGVVTIESPETVRVLRDDMAYAATLAGMAFSNSGVGLVHALEYPIGALTHCGHGEGNGLLLPHVMRFHLASCAQKFRQLAAWLNQGEVETNVREAASNPTIKYEAEAAISIIMNMIERIGIPTRLSQFGLKVDDVDEVAKKAFDIKRLMSLSQQAPSCEDLRNILLSAL